MSIQRTLEEALSRCRKTAAQGKVATYIPELGKADPSALAVAVCDLQGNLFEAGDLETKVTLQSISKVASLVLALQILGEEKVFAHVGVEPTADPFNSIMRLEMVQPHRPQNPLINAGAIVVLSLLPYTKSSERFEAVRDLMRDLTGNSRMDVDEAVYISEKQTSDRNRSLTYFLRSVRAFEGDIEDILDTYFRQCGVSCVCRDLAVMGATLANNGVNPLTGKKVVPDRICVIVRALMGTCGLYDGSGEFALKVGIPAKSGVGGGIMAAVPGVMGVSAIGPALDSKGNSVAGMAVLETLSRELDLRRL